MDHINDGGPAFPVLERGPNGLELTCTGLSKRDVFAAILMHSEAVTCGVPGEACEALIEAAAGAGRDPVDHMAHNAVEGADALLRALAGPQPEQHRELWPSEKWLVETSEKHRAAVYALRQSPAFDLLPSDLRDQIASAVAAFEDAEIPF